MEDDGQLLDLTEKEALHVLTEFIFQFQTIQAKYRGDYEERDVTQKKSIVEGFFRSSFHLYLLKIFQPWDPNTLSVNDVKQVYTIFKPYLKLLPPGTEEFPDIRLVANLLTKCINEWPGSRFDFLLEVQESDYVPLYLNLTQPKNETTLETDTHTDLPSDQHPESPYMDAPVYPSYDSPSSNSTSPSASPNRRGVPDIEEEEEENDPLQCDLNFKEDFSELTTPKVAKSGKNKKDKTIKEKETVKKRKKFMLSVIGIKIS